MREEFNHDIDKVLCGISDILRLEEERLKPTDSCMCEILRLIESDKPADELRAALSEIGVAR